MSWPRFLLKVSLAVSLIFPGAIATAGGPGPVSTPPTPAQVLGILQTATVIRIPNITGGAQVGCLGQDGSGNLVFSSQACGTGSGTITWPSAGSVVVSPGGSGNPTGVAESDGNCLKGSAGSWTTGSCGGSISISDYVGNIVSSIANFDLGPGFLVSGAGTTAVANLNQVDRQVSTCSGTPSPCLVTALDLGGQINFSGAATMTLQIPSLTQVTQTVSASGTTLTTGTSTGVEIGASVNDSATGSHFPNGTIIVSGSGTSWTLNKNVGTIASESAVISMLSSGTSFVATNYSSAPVALACGTGVAINIYSGGCTASLPVNGGIACISNGATLDCVGLGIQPYQAYLNQGNNWTAAQVYTTVSSTPKSLASGTTSYTNTAADCGTTIITHSSTAFTFTALSTVGVGCSINIDQEGAGQVTVISDGSSTITSFDSYTKTAGLHAVINISVSANGTGSAAQYNLTGRGA